MLACIIMIVMILKVLAKSDTRLKVGGYPGWRN
jgi:hypothetical protein